MAVRGEALRRAARLGAWLLALLLPAAQAAADSAGSAPRGRPDNATLVAAQLGLLPDPAIQEYVVAVGERLARHAPARGLDFRFLAVDQWAPNAFALPDGTIAVSRGLLALAGSEDELANVIAHEIVHVLERHALGRSAAARRNPFLVGWAAAGYLAAYSRDQERSADSGGQVLAARAGYDPAALAVFLRKLESVQRLELGASRIPTFVDTHPSTVERLGAAHARGAQLSWRPRPGVVPDATAFVERLEGMVVGDDPAQGVFQGNRFLHPDLDFTLRFPKGWALRNTPLAVGAVAPRGDARIALELAPGATPEEAARRYLDEMRKSAEVEVTRERTLEIDGRAAFEVEASARGEGGRLEGRLNFSELGGRVFLVSAVGRPGAVRKHGGQVTATVRSLRRLWGRERAALEVMRLQLEPAREGESLAAFSERTDNALELQQTAVTNGLFTSDRLEAGQLVKLARSEPYRPGQASPPGAGAGAAGTAVAAANPPTRARGDVAAGGATLPASCQAPTGDDAWATCLADLSSQLEAARLEARAARKDGAGLRQADEDRGRVAESLAEEARQEQGRADALARMLQDKVAEARRAGVSEAVLEGYEAAPTPALP